MTQTISTARAIALQIRLLHQAPHGRYWEVGRLYNLVLKTQVWREEAFPDSDAFFAARTPEVPLANLRLYGTVAEHFKEEDAARHGMARLAYLVAYETAFHGAFVATGHLSEVEIRVPQNGGPIQIRKFAEVGVNDLRNSIRRLKGARDSRALPRPTVSASVAPKMKFPEDSLLGVLAVILGLFAVFIDVDRGGFVLHLGAIPVRAMQLGLALTALGIDFFLRRTDLLSKLKRRFGGSAPVENRRTEDAAALGEDRRNREAPGNGLRG